MAGARKPRSTVYRRRSVALIYDACWSNINLEETLFEKLPNALLDPSDPQINSKLEQWQRVTAFFAAYSNPDGSIQQGYNPYTTPADFAEKFETHLKLLIKQLLYQEPTETNVPPVTAAAMT